MSGLKIKRGNSYNVAPSEYVITDSAGVVEFYAKTKPESSLSGSYFIKKGAAS